MYISITVQFTLKLAFLINAQDESLRSLVAAESTAAEKDTSNCVELAASDGPPLTV